jgi:hypothetical protein
MFACHGPAPSTGGAAAAAGVSDAYKGLIAGFEGYGYVAKIAEMRTRWGSRKSKRGYKPTMTLNIIHTPRKKLYDAHSSV